METKKLTDYMKSLAGILTSDDNLKAELREEIIKRLEEHDEMEKGIHEISLLVETLKRSQEEI